MIYGAHVLLFSNNPGADRTFFANVLQLPYVDAGDGWLILKLPPAEVAVHPTDAHKHEPAHAGHGLLGASLYLMCDDLAAQIALLKAENVPCTEIDEAPWGIKTTIKLPSGGEIGLYEPRHRTALELP